MDSQGNYSSGNNYNRFDQYTEHNTTAIGEAIQSLKAHYQAKRTVILGHSGGAATAGVMMGLFPGIADAVLLGACPCYIARWRQQLQGRPMRRSLSPHKYIDQIDPSTKVVAVVGENDTNTFPSLSASYVKELKERGIDATLEVIPGQGHSDIAFRSRLYDVLSGLAKGSE